MTTTFKALEEMLTIINECAGDVIQGIIGPRFIQDRIDIPIADSIDRAAID